MRRSLIPTMAAALAAITLAGPAAAQHSCRGWVPPEIQRLERQAFDYHYRNSNGNVFRSSRHFHPTKNVFRSSRHYEQKLAAAYDAKPLRSFIRFGERRGDGALEERVFSYAHHLGRYGLDRAAGSLDPGFYVIDSGQRRQRPALRRVVRRARPQPQAESTPARRATMRVVTLPDGTRRTIITNE